MAVNRSFYRSNDPTNGVTALKDEDGGRDKVSIAAGPHHHVTITHQIINNDQPHLDTAFTQYSRNCCDDLPPITQATITAEETINTHGTSELHDATAHSEGTDRHWQYTTVIHIIKRNKLCTDSNAILHHGRKHWRVGVSGPPNLD